MSQDTPTDTAPRDAGQLVRALMQFARVVRFRKGVVIACIAVACGLGGLYYATATRYYESTAGIFVMQTGHDVLRSTRITPEGARIGLMPTYERILQGSKVLDAAIQGLPPEHQIDFRDAPPEKRAARLAENLAVKTVRHSNVIEVTYRSRKPEAAAAVVQAIVDAYLQYMRRTNKNAAGQSLTILRDELTKIEQKLAAKGQQVLQARQQMVDLGLRKENDPNHPLVTQALELNRAWTEARRMRIEMGAKLAAIQADRASGRDLKQHALSLAAQLGQDILSASLGVNPHNATMVATVQEGLLEDDAELRGLLADGLGPNHPRVQTIQQRMALRKQFLDGYDDALRQKLAKVESEQLGPMLVDFVQQQYDELARREASLEESYLQARNKAVSLMGQMGWVDMLEREEQWLLTARDELLAKISDIDLTQSHGNIRTEMTDTPEIVRAPVSPNLMLVGLFSVALGMAVGVAAVCVLDALDDRFRSPEELESQLGLPILAMVREMTPQEEAGPQALQMHVAPDDVESEAFRTLRTAIAFSRQDTGRLVVCSTEPGDGKTTVLANLAVAFARTGKKTLLIDADMRRPGLTKLLQMRAAPGLTQLLQGEQPVQSWAADLICESGVDGLDVLPSGPRQVNPAELLAGPRLAELLSWAESAYDQVLIDAPPASAAADASIIAGLCDGMLMVLRPDKNRRQAVVRAVSNLHSIGIHPLGLVINGVGAESAGGYYSYAESYGDGPTGYGDADELAEEETIEEETPSVAQHEQAPPPASEMTEPETPQGEADVAADPSEAVDESPASPSPIVPRRAA